MKKILVILFVFVSAQIIAQDRTFTIEESLLKRFNTFYPKNLQGLKWITNSDDLQWIEKIDNQSCLIIADNKGNKKATIKPIDLSLGIQNYFTMEKPISALPTEIKNINFPLYWRTHNIFLFVHEGQVYRYNYQTKNINIETELDAKAENIDYHVQSGNFAYTLGKNLYTKMPGQPAFAVSKDGNKDLVYGQAVHRYEFGIMSGTFWSNDGKKLAFYRMDESMVSDYHTYNFGENPNTISTFKYPMAGQLSHEVTVGVLNMKTAKIIYLKTGEPKEQYLTNIAWSPDDKYVYIAVLNRDQNHMKFKKYDAETGDEISTLFEETSTTYTEPLSPAIFINKGKQFLWQSMSDGHNHIYLYDENGNLKNKLTSGNWDVLEILNPKSIDKFVFFTATKLSPLDRTVYSVNIKTNEIKEVATDKGLHFAQISDKSNFVIDNYSNPSTPRKIESKDANGNLLATLIDAENPMASYEMGNTEVFTIKAADGTTDLYCRTIKPKNFDATKKYPVITYVYGGPHAQMITNAWMNGSEFWMHHLTQKGYIIFTVDNRGSMNRGHNFEAATFRKLGSIECADQIKGLQYLRSQSYVDTSKMGIFGWSFGGFMTTSLMTKYPGMYKVGVAGGPVIDWKSYEIMYTERYMDQPQNNKEGYDQANLLNYVENLQGKLMLIHGTSDDVVLWQHSLSFIKKAVERGKYVDYFVYPGHLHNVQGLDRAHLFRKIEIYFDDFLK